MGYLFKEIEEFVSFDPNRIWVEIGSDRGEGSTVFLASLAYRKNVDFHSVDINDTASKKFNHPNIKWHVSDGEVWCRDILPGIGKKIDFVYFDNFDYTWDINAYNDYIRDQRNLYSEKHNVEMNNFNCQITHLRQLLALESYLSDDAVILCDDTYKFNDCWVGKGGGIVLYLCSCGWEIIQEKNAGVILRRCKK